MTSKSSAVEPDAMKEPHKSDPQGSGLARYSKEEVEDALRGRKRGPKPGATAGVKRKASDEYSNDPSAVKTRKRKAGMSDIERQIELAKSRDYMAVRRRKAKIVASPQYQKLSAEEKEAKLKDATTELMSQRFRDETSVAAVALGFLEPDKRQAIIAAAATTTRGVQIEKCLQAGIDGLKALLQPDQGTRESTDLEGRPQ
ncbi:hypothetical protein LTR84_000221 [Exophiala bonariae]|uniref:Uncharacterized protein n=1 Tax=Exophiala bonariae TaxID=1690606 RepID=A0AAV9NTN6_9EURO|nr:hypothetical protein LTR84_000221 [Exophiala bonariae]